MKGFKLSLGKKRKKKKAQTALALMQTWTFRRALCPGAQSSAKTKREDENPYTVASESRMGQTGKGEVRQRCSSLKVSGREGTEFSPVMTSLGPRPAGAL